MWKADFLNMQTFAKNGLKRGRNACFDLLVWSFAMTLLAKTGNAAHEIVADVLCLATLRHVSKSD
jgi:hypothetical protein